MPPHTQTDSACPPSEDFIAPDPRQARLSLACVLLALFLAAFNHTVVATALPRIVAELGGFERYSWVATAYVLTATIATPIVGRLTDTYGRKPFFVTGVAVFTAASAAAGLSQSLDQLIALRAVQGIGGGFVITCCYVSVADLFPPRERGRYQGLIGVVYAVSAIIGPVLGGLVTDALGWNWIFLVNVPTGLIVLLLVAWVFPQFPRRAVDRRIDYPGMVLLVFASVPLLLALSLGGAGFSWVSPWIIGLILFGFVAAVIFVLVEARSPFPIMPLDIFGDHVVGPAALGTLIAGFCLYGTLLFLPLYFQGVQGTSAAGSGGLFTAMLLGIVVGSIVAGQLLSKSFGSYRAHALGSTAAATLGMLLLVTLDDGTSAIMAQVYLVVAGYGLGGALTTFAVAVQNGVPFGRVGAATSALQFCRAVGGMLGFAVLGAVMTTSFTSGLDEALPNDVAAALPGDMLDDLKSNPRTLMDPDAANELAVRLEAVGTAGVGMAGRILEALDTALAGAVGNVFVFTAAVMALAMAAALLLRGVPDPAQGTACGIGNGVR